MKPINLIKKPISFPRAINDELTSKVLCLQWQSVPYISAIINHKLNPGVDRKTKLLKKSPE